MCCFGTGSAKPSHLRSKFENLSKSNLVNDEKPIQRSERGNKKLINVKTELNDQTVSNSSDVLEKTSCNEPDQSKQSKDPPVVLVSVFSFSFRIRPTFFE